MQIDDTLQPGDPCPEEGCCGHLDVAPISGCSCHISAPCSACENSGLACDECGFDTTPDRDDGRAEEEAELARIKARNTAEKRGKRRGETTMTHVANPYNSTPFTDCCGAASFGSRCVVCEALIVGHDDGLAARRREVGPGNCLMCGKKRGDPAVSGNCHC